MKVWVMMLLLVGMLLFPMQAVAQEELIRTELIRAEPVDVIRYLDAQVDYLAEIIARLIKTGKPVLLFINGNRVGAEITLVENMPKRNFNLVGGWTIENNEPSKFFWGIEYELPLTGETWKVFKRLRPAIYNCEGKWYWGFSFELRPEE